MVEVYGKHEEDKAGERQGGIVAFNILKMDGSYVGYFKVMIIDRRQKMDNCHSYHYCTL